MTRAGILLLLASLLGVNSGSVLSNRNLDRSVMLRTINFRKGVTAPTDVTLGTTPTVPALRFAATNELASLTQLLPTFDWNKTANIQVFLLWSLVSAETNGDQISTTLDYVAWQQSSTGQGLARASTQLTSNTTVTTGNGLAVGDIYVQTFTLAAADATNPLANADGISFEIHLTNTTGVASVDLIAGCVNYDALH